MWIVRVFRRRRHGSEQAIAARLSAIVETVKMGAMTEEERQAFYRVCVPMSPRERPAVRRRRDSDGYR
jgi:hypothetical protein